MPQTDDTIPTLTHATERDVDLILVEELDASPDFVAWLAGTAGWRGAVSEWRVLHSARRMSSRRQIDIQVEIRSANHRRPTVLLVENKLDAEQQPEQAESYRQEIDLLRGSCDFAAMILVCPEAYAAAHASFAAKFDSVVTYERIAAQLCARAGSESGELRARLEFRSRLVEQAVSKGRRGYVPVPVPSIENFNARYVALLAEIAPEIFPGQTMLRSGKPGDSVSMIYDERRSLDFLAPDVMPRRFSHELGRNQNHRANYVAVTFGGWGRALPLAGTEMLACVERSGISLHAARRTPNRPNPGLVMSLPTPPVDNQGNFDSQFVAVRQGIAQAIALRAWLADNQALLRTWSRTISGIRA